MGAETSGCSCCGAASTEPRCASCGASRVVGRYQVLGLLAQSPHGRTYRARGPQGVVALKELVFTLVPTAAQLDAFEREARVLASLSHPRIPRFLESFRDGAGAGLRLYLAQELVDGAPLSGARLSEAEARTLAREVLQVLVYLHGRGVVHRDLKPANLVRRPDGAVAVVDFGAARPVDGVTHGATLVGTFGYMPPEQLGGTVDETSDLYALGATLIHLQGGKPPAELLSPDLELRVDHLQVSPSWRAFLLRLVARRRVDRPRTAEEALTALDAKPPVPWGPLPLAVLALTLLAAVAVPLLLLRGGAKMSLGPAGGSDERLRRALAEVERPTPSPPPPAPQRHRDVALGQPLSGSQLRELAPDLPACFEHVGIDLSRLRLWPGTPHAQVKVVMHAPPGHSGCDWMSVDIALRRPDGTSLRQSGRQGEVPRDGWQELLYDFELPPELDAVRLELSVGGRVVQAWRMRLDGQQTRRAGFALVGTVPAPKLSAALGVTSGCAVFEDAALERLWVELPESGGRRLEGRLRFAHRKLLDAPCAGASREWVVRAEEGEDQRVAFQRALPEDGHRVRLPLGPRAGSLRLDLIRGFAEREAAPAP